MPKKLTVGKITPLKQDVSLRQDTCTLEEIFAPKSKPKQQVHFLSLKAHDTEGYEWALNHMTQSANPQRIVSMVATNQHLIVITE